jgi:hypothetical protein
MLASTVVAVPIAAPASTYRVRAHWQPSGDASVSGYRVYTRVSGGGFTLAVDAGMPAPSSDGTLAATVVGLVPCTTYGYAVTGYRSDGSESAFSNEVILTYAQVAASIGSDDPSNCCTSDADCSTTDACQTNARCAAGQCLSDPVPDGSSCDDGSACTQNALCAGGICGRSAALPDVDGTLDDARTRLTMRATTNGMLVVARASFPGVSKDELGDGETTFTLHDASGALLFETRVAGSRFTRTTDGRVVYRDDQRDEGGGFTLIELTPRSRRSSLTLRALLRGAGRGSARRRRGRPQKETAAQLKWSLSTGSGCIDGAGQCKGRGQRCR